MVEYAVPQPPAKTRILRVTPHYEPDADGQPEAVERGSVIHWIDLPAFSAMAEDVGRCVVSALTMAGHEPGQALLQP